MYQTYDYPPSFVCDALLDDLNGKVQPRLLGAEVYVILLSRLNNTSFSFIVQKKKKG